MKSPDRLAGRGSLLRQKGLTGDELARWAYPERGSTGARSPLRRRDTTGSASSSYSASAPVVAWPSRGSDRAAGSAQIRLPNVH